MSTVMVSSSPPPSILVWATMRSSLGLTYSGAPALMPSPITPFMSSVLVMTRLWPMEPLFILPTCLRCTLNSLQLLSTAISFVLYFMLSPASTVTSQAAWAKPAVAIKAAAARARRAVLVMMNVLSVEKRNQANKPGTSAHSMAHAPRLLKSSCDLFATPHAMRRAACQNLSSHHGDSGAKSAGAKAASCGVSSTPSQPPCPSARGRQKTGSMRQLISAKAAHHSRAAAPISSAVASSA